MQTAGAAPAGTDTAPASRTRVRRPRTLRLATTVSIVVHGGLLAAALAIPARQMLDDERVTVDIVEPAVPPPTPAAEPPPPKPTLARAALVKKTRPIETPAAAPASPPPPEEQPAAEPTPPVASAPTTETTTDPRAGAVAAAPAGAGISGGGPGVPGGRGPVGAPTEIQRRALVERYRDELLRTRIRDNFRYPPDALELELTGRVVVQVTVDRNGRLLAARLSGSCPHQVLCQDGLRTVQAAAPFPPLPPDLGDSLRFEIPLKYDFQ